MNSVFVLIVVAFTLTLSLCSAVPHGAMAREGTPISKASVRNVLNAKVKKPGHGINSERVNCVCPAVYDPVCCLRVAVTFIASNGCQCTCSKGVVIGDDKCNLTGPPTIFESIRKVIKADM